MSWNRTVTCSYCYNRGHNRRSCPDLKQYAYENPDSVDAQRYKDSKTAGKQRRCTWCNLQGHNRRTCGSLRIAKEAWKDGTSNWRREWAEWMVELRMGIGALVKVPVMRNYGEPREEVVKVLVGYQWSTLTEEEQTGYSYGGLMLADLGTLRNKRPYELPEHPTLTPHRYDSKPIEIVGPVMTSVSQIIALAPEWFNEGSTCHGLDDVFNKDRKSDDYDENRYK